MKKLIKYIKVYKTILMTYLDVRKLETFKKNNLTYKIFWNIDEVKNWMEELNSATF